MTDEKPDLQRLVEAASSCLETCCADCCTDELPAALTEARRVLEMPERKPVSPSQIIGPGGRDRTEFSKEMVGKLNAMAASMPEGEPKADRCAGCKFDHRHCQLCLDDIEAQKAPPEGEQAGEPDREKQRREFLDGVNRDFEKLRNDPKAWTEYLKERELWDRTSVDGEQAGVESKERDEFVEGMAKGFSDAAIASKPLVAEWKRRAEKAEARWKDLKTWLDDFVPRTYRYIDRKQLVDSAEVFVRISEIEGEKEEKR